MRRKTCWGSVLLVVLLAGCVERRFVISSDPPGAAVFRDGQLIGFTPVDDYFVYYGDKEYVLVKDGFETLKVKQPAPPPWYEIPPLDFFAENVWPCKIHDIRRPPPYQLQPLQKPNPKEVLDRAQGLRDRGRTLEPAPQEGAPPAPVGGPPAEAPPTPRLMPPAPP